MSNKAIMLIDMLQEEIHDSFIGDDIPGTNEALRAIVELQSKLMNMKPKVKDYGFEDVRADVINWGLDKGILAKADQQAQMLKCVSEVGELADAVAKNDFNAIIDGVGDVLVTLILLCEIKDICPTFCLKSAYGEIKNRQGKMVNGVFVKDAPV